MKAHFLNSKGKLVLREATTTVGVLYPGSRAHMGENAWHDMPWKKQTKTALERSRNK